MNDRLRTVEFFGKWCAWLMDPWDGIVGVGNSEASAIDDLERQKRGENNSEAA